MRDLVSLYCLKISPEVLICVLQRIRIEEIRKDPWFRRNYVPAKLGEDEEVNLDDVRAVFDDIEVGLYFLSHYL